MHALIIVVVWLVVALGSMPVHAQEAEALRRELSAHRLGLRHPGERAGHGGVGDAGPADRGHRRLRLRADARAIRLGCRLGWLSAGRAPLP
jgi:hypothetical protein